MTATPFDLATAKEQARDESERKLFSATGQASNAFDDVLMELFESRELTPTQKTEAMIAISVNAKAILQAAMSGQQARQLDGGAAQQSDQGAHSRRSGDEDRDLADRLARAEAAKRDADTAKRAVEQEHTKALRAIERATGVSIAVSDDGKVQGNLEQTIKDSLDAAKQAGRDEAIGDGNVPAGEVKAAVDKIKAAWSTKRKARLNDDWVVNLNRGNDLDDGLTELDTLLS